MTKIVFYKNPNNKIKGFTVTGHTDFALEGNDILCAAISVLVSHTIGSIQEFTDEPCENIVDEDQPSVRFLLTGDTFEDVGQIFLESFASSADDLAFKFPNNINVEYTEK